MMSLKYEASKDFYNSLQDVDTLVDFARNEDRDEHQDNRTLFLKLATVAMVTRFQVFVESILSEFMYLLKEAKIKYCRIPIHMRLSSLQIKCLGYNLSKKLENHETYKSPLYITIQKHLGILNKHYSEGVLSEEFNLSVKFPPGKTGKNNLVKLFTQFEGKNIFIAKRLDIDNIDSIFQKRNLIIHQDRCNQLTEADVLADRHYFQMLAKHIDQYLDRKLKQYKGK